MDLCCHPPLLNVMQLNNSHLHINLFSGCINKLCIVAGGLLKRIPIKVLK